MRLFVPVVILVAAAGCLEITDTPENAVKKYFEAWDNENWQGMYALITDDFKAGEETAKSLTNFSAFMSRQNVHGISIMNIGELSQSENTSAVRYKVEFILNATRVNSTSGFNLLKEGRWKISNPYGSVP